MTRNQLSQPRYARGNGVRIARIAGIDLAVDWSLLVIVALITASLGAGWLPAQHPEWSPLLTWGLALTASLLFIASIAMHELSHALVGRRHDVPIRRITLFVFGGMAHMDKPPPSPKAEFLMAIIGPVVSIVFGLAVTIAGLVLAQDAAVAREGDPAAIAAAIGPTATLLLWLGPINVLLGVFNLVPGFPLDGGRVLRSALWWMTGDLRKATQWAAGGGQVFGWLLMGLGIGMAFGLVVPVLGGGLVQGMWLLLIGWFLSNAARASYQQVVVSEALAGVPISDVMRSRIESVPPDLPIARLVSDYIMASDHVAFPVVQDAHLLGMVEMSDVRRAPRERWEQLRVADIMTPLDQLDTMDPSDAAVEALRRLAEHEEVAVVQGDRLLGVARRQDLVKWVAMQQPDWN